MYPSVLERFEAVLHGEQIVLWDVGNSGKTAEDISKGGSWLSMCLIYNGRWTHTSPYGLYASIYLPNM